MATRHYVVLVRDDQGDVIDHYDADAEVQQLRQQISDLREMLDHARRIAFEFSKDVLGKS